MPTLLDNMKLLQRLFPNWKAPEEVIDLWFRRLERFDQVKVKAAMEDERIAAGRFNTPNLDAVLKRLAGSGAIAASSTEGAAPWMALYDRLDHRGQRAADGYRRMMGVATQKQANVIMRYYGMRHASDVWEITDRDPMELKDRVMLVDDDLRDLVFDLVASITDPKPVDIRPGMFERMMYGVTRSIVTPNAPLLTGDIVDVESNGGATVQDQQGVEEPDFLQDQGGLSDGVEGEGDSAFDS